MKPLAALGAVIVAGVIAPAMALEAGGKSIDPEFLEFLGSIDSEGEGWGEFLSNTDLERRAPAPRPPPARKPPPAAAPAPPPEQQPVKGGET